MAGHRTFRMHTDYLPAVRKQKNIVAPQGFPNMCAVSSLNNTYKFSSYLIENTTHLHYKDQLVNVVKGNNRCLFWESCETHKYTLRANYRVSEY
jgi:hypothetical protein